MGTSPERLERSFEDSYCLTDLPSEVLVLILEYLPLQDLANVRLVSSVCLFVDGRSLNYRLVSHSQVGSGHARLSVDCEYSQSLAKKTLCSI